MSAGAIGTGATAAQPISHDEDNLSLSSSNTDLYERSSTNSPRKGKWQLDISGAWRRYGSTESAPSTALSSMSSSTGLDDPANEITNAFSPSRKRMLDGSLKRMSMTLSNAANGPTTVGIAGLDVPATSLNALPKKKRGRPSNAELAKRRQDAESPFVTENDGKVKLEIANLPTNDKSKSSRKSLKTTGVSRTPVNARPRSSIPSRLPAEVFASQCIEAAFASRLDPYSLHPGEHQILHEMLMSKEVTVYLNIRNAILRLWTQNVLCCVTAEEALGCAKEGRFFGLAEVAYKWLVRNGYINFGCVETIQDLAVPHRFSKDSRQRTVVVVGAGVSGLTTARQLENLFSQEASKWIGKGEKRPRVIVLEGRKRIGGRVYSKPLRSQVKGSLPGDLRNTAETGAMIVTGFERGNPLDTIIRGQLGLHYHLMRDSLTIYDCDGKPVGERRDMRNTELYTDISDRAGQFRVAPRREETLRGDEDMIKRCRDPVPDGFTDFQLEPLYAAHIKAHEPAARRGRRRNVPPGTEKLTGRSQVVEGGSATQSASRAAKTMGWDIRPGVAKNQSISLHRAANANVFPTLGAVMDEAIVQYQDLVELTPLDMRLLNWHHANLEYANAAPVSWLSLSGHDQDTGNEFEGYHAEVVGGYTQLPRGLFNLPTKLDVRFERTIKSIHYRDGAEGAGPSSTKVVCTNGEVIEADEIVLTVPLGVLKSQSITFNPPLPDWKQGAVERMGFGLLNKVILLYETPFWDQERDMFGLLNDPVRLFSLDPADYQGKRGRFYLIWNASKISGRPMLIALMAGHAAHDAEYTDTATLVNGVTHRLRGVFTKVTVPMPLEVIVTRWKRDPFTKGTYSFVGPQTQPGDYDVMAKPVGNLHFAGEATCGTHPATVHGAFISGLRAASEVMDSLCGSITLPRPLVEPFVVKQEPRFAKPENIPLARTAMHDVMHDMETLQAPTAAGPVMIKQEEAALQVGNISAAPMPAKASKELAGPPAKSVCATDVSFWVSPSYDSSDLNHEAGVFATILSEIGERPVRPNRPGVNPFLLFTKDKWEECRAFCVSQHMSNGRDVIRQTLGKWWKAADDSTKQPYLVQSQNAQASADAVRREWEAKVVQWEKDASRLRAEYAHGQRDALGSSSVASVGVSKRKTNVSNCVVLDHA